jgi:hypothetical protein
MERPRRWTRRSQKAVALSAAWLLLLVQPLLSTALGQEQPAAGLAQVNIVSSPSGQTITLDDRLLDTVTPVMLDLPPGKHSLVVTAPGYQSLKHDLMAKAGSRIELRFILMKTPPEPPTQEELRRLGLPEGESSAEGTRTRSGASGVSRSGKALPNESCLQCHPNIPGIQSQGVHASLSCAECHDTPESHVKENVVVGKMQVVRGNGISVLCLTCHDEGNRSGSKAHIRKVAMPQHLTEKKVRPGSACNQCHHVHSPLKWVYEARDIVGLPEVLRSEPLLSEELALDTQRKFNSMAETFLVVPLAPGVIGKMAFPDDSNFPVDALLISGAALVAGSFFLGQFFSSRELKSIKEINAERTLANQRAQNHNKMVERAMADHEAEVIQWMEEAEGRGKVVRTELVD